MRLCLSKCANASYRQKKVERKIMFGPGLTVVCQYVTDKYVGEGRYRCMYIIK